VCKLLLNAVQLNRLKRQGFSKSFVIEVSDSGTTPPCEISDSLPQEIKHVVSEYPDVLKPRETLPPERNTAHTIPLEAGHKPPFRPIYRLSPVELAEVENQVTELLKNGLIEPSSSPYGAPVLFVTKKDGSLRMCIDYTALNKITVKNKYPMPRTDQLLDVLSGAQVFSSLDLQSGYHQIRIPIGDISKTAFRTPFGHYQFKVLSFGLTNAPATFQAAMNDIFRPLLGKCVVVYIDDILVFSKTHEEHAKHLCQVMQILQNQDFRVKLSKCEFAKSEVKFLGHVVGADGIKVDTSKTAVVSNWPVPNSLSPLRSFLGLATYFRKFIANFSTMVAPLTHLTKKDVPYAWCANCQKAFEEVKHALTHAPVLALPDFSKPFEVSCDASIQGLGAVLLQEGRPIAYESRKLIPAEVRYTTGEQELLAVVHALKVWRCYLEGPLFTVITDHNPLVHLNTQPNLSRRQCCWMEYLQRFNFKWLYRPGKDNMADPLSRNPPQTPLENEEGHRQVNTLSLLLGVLTRSKGKKPKEPMKSVQQCMPNKKRKRQQPFLVCSPPEETLPANNLSGSPFEQNTEIPRGGEEHEEANDSWNPDTPSEDAVTGIPKDNLPTGLEVADVLGFVRRAYEEDPRFQNERHTSKLVNREGWWYTQNERLVIPNVDAVKHAVIQECHAPPCVGHVGTNKTRELVERKFFWPTLGSDVRKYVNSCHQCQINKATNQRPAGLLQPLPIPCEPWESVSMDFITQLPVTKEGHDSIFVVVDRLTKMTHLIPTHTTVTARGVAQLFKDHVWVHHGYPKNFVTDRDSKFTSIFWEELQKCCGIKHHKSSAYHPQTDGQTERMNRVLEDMLRNYVSPQQND